MSRFICCIFEALPRFLVKFPRLRLFFWKATREATILLHTMRNKQENNFCWGVGGIFEKDTKITTTLFSRKWTEFSNFFSRRKRNAHTITIFPPNWSLYILCTRSKWGYISFIMLAQNGETGDEEDVVLISYPFSYSRLRLKSGWL